MNKTITALLCTLAIGGTAVGGVAVAKNVKTNTGSTTQNTTAKAEYDKGYKAGEESKNILLEEYKNNVDTLREQLNNATDQRKLDTEKIAGLDTQISELNKKITDCNKKANEDKASIEALSADVEAKEQRISELSADKEANAAEIERLTLDVENKRAEISELQNNLIARQTDVDNLSAQVTSLNTEKTNLSAQLNELNAEIATVRAELNEKQDTITQIENGQKVIITFWLDKDGTQVQRRILDTGDVVVFPTITAPNGYKFLGTWSGFDPSAYIASENVTMKPDIIQSSFVLTFYGNEKEEIQKVTCEESFVLPELDAQYIPAGKRFTGWLYNVTGEILQPGNVIPVESDKEFFAQFEDVELLANYTWEQISTMSADGTAAQKFQIGDVKTFEINELSYEAKIIDFGHDDLADGSGKAGITFMVTQAMNYSDYNSLTTITNSDIFPYVKTVSKKTIQTTNDDMEHTVSIVDQMETTEEKFFRFSAVELIGSKVDNFSISGEIETINKFHENLRNEGFQYSYFATTNFNVEIPQAVLDAHSGDGHQDHPLCAELRTPVIEYSYGALNMGVTLSDGGIETGNRYGCNVICLTGFCI